MEQVAADSLFDPNQKEAFYTVLIRTDEAQLTRNGEVYTIIPGMITDVDIIVGRKSILTYLLKPLNKARQEALRERWRRRPPDRPIADESGPAQELHVEDAPAHIQVSHPDNRRPTAGVRSRANLLVAPGGCRSRAVDAVG